MPELSSLEVQIVAFAAGLVLLIKGADFFVDGVTVLAERAGISKLTVGLTVVAIGTSAPEFAVSIYAALQGSGDIAVANVVGSNVFNLGFILAICAIIAPFAVDKLAVYRDGGVAVIGCLALSMFALLDGAISRTEGTVLILGLVLYVGLVLRHARNGCDQKQAGDLRCEAPAWSKHITALSFAGGLVALLYGCRLVVDAASAFAKAVGWSDWLIGVTIIAVGTSLPELVTAVTSVVKRNADIGVGGLLGSDIFNVFGVVGMSALIAPMNLSGHSAAPFLLLCVATVAVTLFLRSGFRLSRVEGFVIFGLATFRFAVEVA